MGTVSSAIAGARERLEVARFGLSDISDRKRSRAGFLNAIVFGRMVTFQLQNMRSTEPKFDPWWDEQRAMMREDPIFSTCNELRTKIEKTSETGISKGFVLNYNSGTDQVAFGDPPPGAIGQFFGDPQGRSGWIIRAADGSESEYFVDLPERIIRSIDFIEVSGEHYEAVRLATEYLDKLETLINAAAERFT